MHSTTNRCRPNRSLASIRRRAIRGVRTCSHVFAIGARVVRLGSVQLVRWAPRPTTWTTNDRNSLNHLCQHHRLMSVGCRMANHQWCHPLARIHSLRPTRPASNQFDLLHPSAGARHDGSWPRHRPPAKHEGDAGRSCRYRSPFLAATAHIGCRSSAQIGCRSMRRGPAGAGVHRSFSEAQPAGADQ